VRLLLAGTYERSYPRIQVLRTGLVERGHTVVECHVPVWERTQHKAGGFLRSFALIGSLVRAAGAWVQILTRERRIDAVDAVMAGYPAQLDAPLTWVIARRRRVPLVVDMMISFGDTLGGDRGRAGARMTRLLAWMDAQLVRSADVVVADTMANADWIQATFPRARGRVIVVPVGAEPERFPQRSQPEPPVRALFVGKLAPLHGLGVVLEAARYPGVPPIRIIGDGQLREWLDGELARNRPPGLEHIPWVPYDQLGDELAAAHICLGIFGGSGKASRVIPNKVWQAMAVGRPIITADTPGAREVLRDGRDALLVPAGDAAALAAALARLVQDPDLRARLGTQARCRYEEAGAPSPVADRFIAGVVARLPGLASASAQ
jgi:glycosyltransferase involved in cell wall biosynthesis